MKLNLNRHFQGIVPPHVLKRIAKNGSETQKDQALRSLALSEQFRGARISFISLSETAAISPGHKSTPVYDAQHRTRLPGKLVRNDGSSPSADVSVNEAYDGVGATYDMFKGVYGRNSIDNKGMPLISSVHYGVGYQNAFFNGHQMVFGDGDGEIFDRFTKCIDVIGHELTHGVTDRTAGLEYDGQSGALNESFSDVFGSLLKQKTLGQTTSEADWLIGEGLLMPNINGKALRSMKDAGTAYDDPLLGKDPQPGYMKDYVQTDDDNHGVHTNSGIPNHAFYYAATEIGGYAWEKAGMIWYITLTRYLNSTSDFQQAADALFQVAGNLYGENGKEQKAVGDAWDKVGIKTTGKMVAPTIQQT